MKVGKVPENVLKRSVLRQIKNKQKEVCVGAGLGVDCAVFSLPEQNLLATCVQEAAVAMKPDRLGIFSMSGIIQKCVNNLAAGGAVPFAVMIGLMLPQGTEESDIKAFMAEAEEICARLSIQIAGGQTNINRAVTEPVAVVTGYGKLSNTIQGGKPAKKRDGFAVCPGQDVVISKWIGLEGTAFLARKYRDRLLERYPAYLVDEAAGFDKYLSVIPEAATAVESGVCSMHDASEGGIFGALRELAERAGVGLTIDLKKIPLRQETVEVCECCEVNPYELLSGGCLIMTTQDGPGLVTALEEKGIPAVIVGRVTDSNDRILINEDEVRFIDRAKQDEIYRIGE